MKRDKTQIKSTSTSSKIIIIINIFIVYSKQEHGWKNSLTQR
jgi:hypothetical protein